MSSKSPGAAGILRNRFVQLIVLSNVLLQVGIWVRNFAILLYVMDMTNNDPTAVSLISVAEFAPIFIFSFIGGTFADRWRPKRTMVWCDILSAISVFGVLLTLVFGTWQAVFFVTLVSAILSQFSQPSAMKLFKQHVPAEQLQTSMAMFQSIMAIFMIIGPMIGTYVYQTYGISVAVAVMGVAFVLSAVVLSFMPKDIVDQDAKKTNNFWQELGDGLKYVWKKPELKMLGGGFLFAGLAVGLMQPLGVFLVTERLGLPKESLKWLMVVNGVAMMIGGGLVMGLSKKLSPQKLLALGMFAMAITVIGSGLSTNVPLTLSFQFVNGLFFPCIHIGISTLILQSTEESYVGRVNGVLNPMFMGMMVITMSIAGWLKELTSLVMVYGVAGCMFIFGMLCIVPIFKMKLAQPQTQTQPIAAE